jgi:glycosyltransferase involved in cell wall biosynthesis
MRVLHVPSNLASQMSVLVNGLRSAGVEARGLVLDNASIQSADGLEAYARDINWRRSIRGWWQTLKWWTAFASAVRWADVVHWHFHLHTFSKDLALRYIARLHKPRLVEFHGSDIRIPEIAMRDNPYLAAFMASGQKTDYVAAYPGSRITQAKFARYGFACLVQSDELLEYVQRDLYPRVYQTQVVVDLAQFQPAYPDPARRRPIVVHTPSHFGVKGTASVLRAIEQLKSRFDFEFKLIHNLPHHEALTVMADSDIMLDQFVIGTYGVAPLEAMAFGKPAVCYIKPSLAQKVPADFCIVNANPDNLVEVLAGLLADGSRRHALGRCGRAYVEQHHSVQRVVPDLIQIYRELIER